ncbi:MAG: glycosyltransferase [Candidatus Verstraetearchaeota archaeon]|nr:glycosyltransferase [Candidatus Verstraetearchaeota archaeon]
MGSEGRPETKRQDLSSPSPKTSGNPKVSVIIPCYNGEKFIGEAIESVLNQTYQNFEIIIVDDGSTDGSKSVIKTFLKDPRIKLIEHERNKGIPAARNTAIKASKGEFIAFLDQDDLWYPEKLEKSLDAFERGGENLGVVFSDVDIEEKDGSVTRRTCRKYDPAKLGREGFIRALFWGNFIPTSSAIVRKTCFAQMGLLDEQLYGSDDRDFWLRIAGTFEFHHIPEALAKLRRHGANASLRGAYTMIEQSRLIITPRAIQRYPFLLPLKRKKISRLYYNFGAHLIRDRKPGRARRFFIKAILEDPLNWKAWARFLLSLKDFKRR